MSQQKEGAESDSVPHTARGSEPAAESSAALAATQRLPIAGRSWRLLVSLVVIGLTLLGTLWGTDADFPFGPFRMFASADPVNRPVKSTRLEATTESGERIVVHGANIGMRRAEFEGQMNRFRRDPSLIAAMVDAYEKRNPNRPRLDELHVVVREFELRDGKPTKQYEDVIVLTWKRGEDS